MKLDRIIAGLFAAATLFFCVSCDDDEIETGIDPSLPGPENVTYDEISSGANTIAVYWDTDEADAAGATSWTVQLVEDLTMGGDNYDSSISKTLQTSDEDTRHDMAVFSSLTDMDQYYVRVRANYPKSKYSDWAYVELNGEMALIEVGTGLIDLNVSAPDEVYYSEELSSSTSIGVYVDASSASSDGASKIIIMLKPYLSSGTTYTAELSAASSVTNVFSNLTYNDKYYIYARAAYLLTDGSYSYSTWTQATDDDMVLYAVGVGPTSFDPPTAALSFAGTSTLIFKWSESNFEDVDMDQALNVRIQLYSDEDCTNLQVAWTFSGNPYGTVSSSYKVFYTYTPCFCFSGLRSGTTYYFVVTDTDTGLSSDPVSGTTEEFEVVEVSGSAAVGDVVLAENFGELTIGGDFVNKAPGFSSSSRSSFTSQPTPSGEQPDGTYTAEYYGNEVGLFNTMASSIASTRIDNWCTINEGSSNSYICERPGQVKLGASSYTAHITTPKLSSLTGVANLEVTFKAARYSTDSQEGAVYTVTGGSVDDSHILSDATKTAVYTFETASSTSVWTEYTCTIQNVTSSMRLAFGVAPRDDDTDAGSVQKRIFITDIVVKVKEYVGDITVEAPTDLTLSSTATSITASWNAGGTTDEYTVEYKESAESSYTVAGTTTSTNYTISDLTAATSYDVRVKASYSGVDSDYAEATISTQESTSIPTEISSADELVTWLAGANDGSTGEYKIVSDIDMSGKTIASSVGFAGTLDGQGYSIKNLSSTVPLFETTASTAVVKNIVLDASCSFTASNYVFGPIVGENYGTISGCTNNAPVSYTYDTSLSVASFIGGIAGASFGAVSDCTNNGAVTQSSDGVIRGGAAGIVAYMGAAISGCTNYGTITHSGTRTGSKVSAYSSASTLACNVGGVVAYGEDGFSMSSCNNYGTVNFTHTAIDVTSNINRHMIGGVVGNPIGSVESCNNYGAVNVSAKSSTGAAITGSGTEYIVCVGGVSGGDYNSSSQNVSPMSNCTNSGTVTVDFDAAQSNSAIGGVVGWPGVESKDQTITITNCSNSGDVIIKGYGKGRIGGFIGGSGNLVSCSNTGTLTIESTYSTSVAGAFAGFHTTTTHCITDCTAGGSVVTKTALAGLGGLVGNFGNVANSATTGCTVNCTLTDESGSIDSTISGMVVGLWNGTSYAITIGTSDTPIKVSGSILGTAITESNYESYLSGTKNASSDKVIYAEYGGE